MEHSIQCRSRNLNLYSKNSENVTAIRLKCLYKNKEGNSPTERRRDKNQPLLLQISCSQKFSRVALMGIFGHSHRSAVTFTNDKSFPKLFFNFKVQQKHISIALHVIKASKILVLGKKC